MHSDASHPRAKSLLRQDYSVLIMQELKARIQSLFFDQPFDAACQVQQDLMGWILGTGPVHRGPKLSILGRVILVAVGQWVEDSRKTW
jgi:hypothetical protein